MGVELVTSVTRFGEISPSGQHFKSLRQLFTYYLAKCWTLFGHFQCYWAHFHHDNWENIDKNVNIWSHWTLTYLSKFASCLRGPCRNRSLHIRSGHCLNKLHCFVQRTFEKGKRTNKRQFKMVTFKFSFLILSFLCFGGIQSEEECYTNRDQYY